MSLETRRTEYARLVILRLLMAVPGYTLDERLLGEEVNGFGCNLSRDALRTQMAWLAEQGLLTVNALGGVTQIAKLAVRGKDVAEGLAQTPGVARPELEDLL